MVIEVVQDLVVDIVEAVAEIVVPEDIQILLAVVIITETIVIMTISTVTVAQTTIEEEEVAVVNPNLLINMKNIVNRLTNGSHIIMNEHLPMRNPQTTKITHIQINHPIIQIHLETEDPLIVIVQDNKQIEIKNILNLEFFLAANPVVPEYLYFMVNNKKEKNHTIPKSKYK